MENTNDFIIKKSDSHYKFDTDKFGFPTFTKKNIEFLNAILQYDSNYRSSSGEYQLHKNDQNYANTIKEYEESYAWILQNKEIDFFNSFKKLYPNLNEKDNKDKLGKPIDALYKVIESIDKINSTHLAAEGTIKKKNKGREIVAERIREIGGEHGEKLKERLKSKDKDEKAKLVKEIATAVETKLNFSFATKFCAYVSTHALNDPDNFCIYDNVVQSVLPYYAKMYVDESIYEEKKYSELYKTVKSTKANEKKPHYESLVEKKYRNKDGYKGYMELIDDIIEGIETKTGEKITYQDFDHMVWYYFKGSKGRVRDAMAALDWDLKNLPEKGKK